MSDDPPQSPTPSSAPLPASTEDHEATIQDLRTSLASAQSQLSAQSTKLSTLSDLTTELAQLKDQHSFLKAAKEAVESQLQAERVKREAAEESADDLRGQIETLRGQVEAARRGVGILQKQEKERKRMSTIGGGSGLGLTGGVEAVLEEAPDVAQPTTITDKAAKRASMILGGGKHKRSSSTSEGSDHPAGGASGGQLSTSPNLAPGGARAGLRELRLGAATVSTPPSLYSPSIAEASDDPTRMPPYRSVSGTSIGTVGTVGTATSPSKRDAALREAVAKEREAREAAESAARDAEEQQANLSRQVTSLQRRLEEAEEARVASDACLQALRDFIAGGSGAEGQDPLADPATASSLLKGISLPPLPTDRDADLRDDKPLPARPSPRKANSAAGWGFTSLFRGGAGGPPSPAISTTVEPPATPQPLLSPPATVRTSSTPRVSPLPTPQELDERAVEGLPSAAPVTWVSSWTKNVPSSGGGSSSTTPIAPGPSFDRGEPLSPPMPPSSTRKLSSFFGFNRETRLPVSHDFDAHDAFTPEAPSGEHLEPSPMPLEESEAEVEGEDRPTPQTMTTATTDEVATPMLLSPRSQVQSVIGEEGTKKRMDGVSPEGVEGATAVAI